MRNSIRVTAIIVGVVFIISGWNVCYAQEKLVTATGKAEIGVGSKEEYRQKALENAFRNAVEKELGIYIQSNTTIKNGELVKNEILTKATGYILEHEIIKEEARDGNYYVIVEAKISVERIGEDFKAAVAEAKSGVGNPSITFVLTTWAKKGIQTTVISSYARSTDSSGGVSQVAQSQKIDETKWDKIPSIAINDAFREQFLNNGFDLMAADQATDIAMSESLATTAVNPRDRKMVLEMARKEGAKYVARGEAWITELSVSRQTGEYVATAEVGVEIVDVDSGDTVGAYSKNSSFSSVSEASAKSNAIVKIATLAAKTLSEQTVDKWKERARSGRKYTIEVQNITSMRRQQKPILDAIGTVVAVITAQTSPKEGILLLKVDYKGDSHKLGDEVLSQLDGKEGFSEKEFDGPFYEEGKVVFKFITAAAQK